MNYFTPGLRELARIVARQARRAQLIFERRKLARVETELGLLGWQQAEFDEETESHVRLINESEREQSRLMNESAALALAMREVEEKRAAMRAEFEPARAALLAEREEIAVPLEALERRLAARRGSGGDFEKRAPELERELREVRKKHGELQGREKQTLSMRAELIRLRDRMIAIPNELGDLRAAGSRAASEVQALEREIAAKRTALAEADARARKLDAEFSKNDGELAKKLAAWEREKGRIEKQADAMEKEKAKPYREIGQVLADSGVAPRNQPQALEAVRAQRVRVAKLEFEIAASLDASGKEDRAALRKSWVVWAAIVVALGCAVVFAAWR